MIRFDDTIKLLKSTGKFDEELNNIEEYDEIEVFCNISSISRIEFYDASTTGLKPEMKIVLNEFEYENEEKIVYKGQTYSILRTFKKDKYIELIVGEKIG